MLAALALCGALFAALSGAAHARAMPSPADFQGHWRVTRMVGVAEVTSDADYHTLLGTTLEWTATTVTDTDGICVLPPPRVVLMTNELIQDFLWGHETIAALDLPKALIARAFGRTQTPVFDDGYKGCAGAILLDHDHLLMQFHNGYLYELRRVGRH